MDILKQKQEVLEWALLYIEKGWAVFPIHSVTAEGRCSCNSDECKDIGKHPRLPNGLKGASSEKEDILRWFGPEAPLSNIGIITGEQSCITVVDIDIVKKNGAETWVTLNNNHVEPETLVSVTGSGGMHQVFIYNSALATKTDSLGEGVDVRNDGGYIVAPPSIHVSGARYHWDNWGAKIASLPAHLVPSTSKKKGRARASSKYSVSDVIDMLKYVKSENRDNWRNVGIILGREFNCSDQMWEIYVNWSDEWSGPKGPKHDQIMREAYYEISKTKSDKELSIGSLVAMAAENGWTPKRENSSPKDNFVYYAPGNDFIYIPTCDYWPKEAVDAKSHMVNDEGKLVTASAWLKKHRAVTSLVDDPLVDAGITKGFDCREGVIFPTEGGCIYNKYMKTNVAIGNPEEAGPFVNHVHKVFNKPGDADQFLNYMAHRVQFPGEKPRFALMIVGEQGVGKDTAITMCSGGIGQWNIANISPAAFESQFNEFAASVLVVISETANTQDISKWAFNEKTKVLIAGLPDYMQINQKYGHKYTVRLHCGVIITTNHMHGVYIPEDDRRYDVIDAASKSEMGLSDEKVKEEYFDKLWYWYLRDGGESHVYAYLLNRDISSFSPATGQRKTAAHKTIVMDNFSNDEWLADAIDNLDTPEILLVDDLWASVQSCLSTEMSRNEFNSKIKHSLKRFGYKKLLNDATKDGRWKMRSSGKYAAVWYNEKKFETYLHAEAHFRRTNKDALF